MSHKDWLSIVRVTERLLDLWLFERIRQAWNCMWLKGLFLLVGFGAVACGTRCDVSINVFCHGRPKEYATCTLFGRFSSRVTPMHNLHVFQPKCFWDDHFVDFPHKSIICDQFMSVWVKWSHCWGKTVQFSWPSLPDCVHMHL